MEPEKIFARPELSDALDQNWREKSLTGKDQEVNLRWEKGKKILQQSGTQKLIDRMVEKNKGSFWENGGENDEGNRGETGYVCRLYISRVPVGPDVEEVKYLEIEVREDGTIKFKGNIYGSSTVRQSDWKKDRNVPRNALTKAYLYPIIMMQFQERESNVAE